MNKLERGVYGYLIILSLTWWRWYNMNKMDTIDTIYADTLLNYNLRYQFLNDFDSLSH